MDCDCTLYSKEYQVGKGLLHNWLSGHSWHSKTEIRIQLSAIFMEYQFPVNCVEMVKINKVKDAVKGPLSEGKVLNKLASLYVIIQVNLNRVQILPHYGRLLYLVVEWFVSCLYVQRQCQLQCFVFFDEREMKCVWERKNKLDI